MCGDQGVLRREGVFEERMCQDSAAALLVYAEDGGALVAVVVPRESSVHVAAWVVMHWIYRTV